MAVNEYFVHGSTFAAPFVSEEVTRYVEGDTPEQAITSLVESMRGSYGIYAADAYASADDYHKNRKPVARWRSNKALHIDGQIEAHGGAASIYSGEEGSVEINGELQAIADPRSGRFVEEG